MAVLGCSLLAPAQLPERLVIETDSTSSLFTSEQLASNEVHTVAIFAAANGRYVLPTDSLQVTRQIASPFGHHITFGQTFEGVPVFGGELKVNLDMSNRVKSFFDRSVDMSLVSREEVRLLIDGFDYAKALLGVDGQVVSSRLVIWPDPPQPALEVTVHHSQSSSAALLVVNSNGETLFRSDLRRRFAGPDSLVSAMVFLPDPLTSAHQTYGGLYRDLNDTDVPSLNIERVSVQMRVAFSSGNFSLENAWIMMSDVSPPNVAPPVMTSPDFSFTRADDRFEDVNAFYHLTMLRQHLEQLGYASLGASQLPVDAHALNGDDQSMFLPTPTPRLVFGEGGVDDAEDADVIIHEYIHYLSYSASGSTFSGFERQAFEEGHCDYLAASYSRAIDAYNWFNVFSWDGHNEFWSGRVVNSNKVYPNDLGSNIHLAGEIWSAAMMEIWEALGRDYTDKLALEAMYSWSVDMTMPEAALTILQADEVISGGANYDVIYAIFVARGLLGDLDDNVANSQALLLRTGDLLVTLSLLTDEAEMQVFDMWGQLIYEQEDLKDKLTVLPHELFSSSGVYFVRLKTEDLELVQKVMLIER